MKINNKIYLITILFVNIIFAQNRDEYSARWHIENIVSNLDTSRKYFSIIDSCKKACNLDEYLPYNLYGNLLTWLEPAINIYSNTNIDTLKEVYDKISKIRKSEETALSGSFKYLKYDSLFIYGLISQIKESLFRKSNYYNKYNNLLDTIYNNKNITYNDLMQSINIILDNTMIFSNIDSIINYDLRLKKQQIDLISNQLKDLAIINKPINMKILNREYVGLLDRDMKNNNIWSGDIDSLKKIQTNIRLNNFIIKYKNSKCFKNDKIKEFNEIFGNDTIASKYYYYKMLCTIFIDSITPDNYIISDYQNKIKACSDEMKEKYLVELDYLLACHLHRRDIDNDKLLKIAEKGYPRGYSRLISRSSRQEKELYKAMYSFICDSIEGGKLFIPITDEEKTWYNKNYVSIIDGDTSFNRWRENRYFISPFATKYFILDYIQESELTNYNLTVIINQMDSLNKILKYLPFISKENAINIIKNINNDPLSTIKMYGNNINKISNIEVYNDQNKRNKHGTFNLNKDNCIYIDSLMSNKNYYLNINTIDNLNKTIIINLDKLPRICKIDIVKSNSYKDSITINIGNNIFPTSIFVNKDKIYYSTKRNIYYLINKNKPKKFNKNNSYFISNINQFNDKLCYYKIGLIGDTIIFIDNTNVIRIGDHIPFIKHFNILNINRKDYILFTNRNMFGISRIDADKINDFRLAQNGYFEGIYSYINNNEVNVYSCMTNDNIIAKYIFNSDTMYNYRYFNDAIIKYKIEQPIDVFIDNNKDIYAITINSIKYCENDSLNFKDLILEKDKIDNPTGLFVNDKYLYVINRNDDKSKIMIIKKIKKYSINILNKNLVGKSYIQ